MNVKIGKMLGVTSLLLGVWNAGAAEYSASDISGLLDAVGKAGAGDVIRLAKGSYPVATGSALLIKPGATLVGGSDNPEETVIYRENPAFNDRGILLGHNAILRNVTVRGGYTEYQAAGVLGYDTGVHDQFVVSNCVIEGCSAKYMGAGGCGGTWYNCVIRNNTVRNTVSGANEGSGGGVYAGILYDCVITNNTAGYCGGGLAGGNDNGTASGSPRQTFAYGCLIGWNSAPNGGGAASSPAVTGSGYCILSNCTVIGNTANTGAGASKCKLTDCRLLENKTTQKSDSYGGATFQCDSVVRCYMAGNCGHFGGAGFNGTFTDCVMTNNSATGYDGGATYNATTRNCLVVDNYSNRGFAHCRGAHYGDLVYANRSGGANVNPGKSYLAGIGQEGNELLTVVNCTVWGNQQGDILSSTLTNTVASSVSSLQAAVNSFWQSGAAPDGAVGCVYGTDRDPKFAGVRNPWTVTASTPPEAFKPKARSPLYDGGLTLAGQTAEKDLMGSSRVLFKSVDMGAIESDLEIMGLSIVFR